MANFNRSFLVLFLVAGAVAAAARNPRQIEIARSQVLIRVYKAGLFSAFAHDHEIEPPLASGQVDLTLHGVTRTLSLTVSGDAGVCRDALWLRQSEFRIHPLGMAGGAVKVKDQVRIEFTIRLEQASA